MLSRDSKDPDSTVRLSQTKTLLKITAYLTLQKRDPALIHKFSRKSAGFCNGLAVLAGYGMYLETLSKRGTAPRDDWAWFKRTQEKLTTWDEQLSSLTPTDMSDIEHLIGQMEFFQHVYHYLPIGQSNLHASLEDFHQCAHKSKAANRTLRLEFSIGGLFSVASLSKNLTLFKRKSLSVIDIITMHKRRLVTVHCTHHTLLIFRNRDTIYLYHSGERKGRQSFSMKEKIPLLKKIFKLYKYAVWQMSPIGFKVYTFSRRVKAYPEPARMLSLLEAPSKNFNPDYARGVTGLHMAAAIGDESCVRYFLKDRDLLNQKTADGSSPLYFATRRGHENIAKILIDQGAKGKFHFFAPPKDRKQKHSSASVEEKSPLVLSKTT